jgi:uncharacterized protein YjbJ (UPF0337 family)
MNWDQIQGRWTEFKGRLREQYGELTDDEVEEAKGNEEQLLGLIQRKYGKTKEEARRALDDINV